MADTDTRQAPTNGVGSDEASTPTSTRTRKSTADGTTVKVSTSTYELLQAIRTRLDKRNDAVIRKALRLLDAKEPGRAQTDDEWADS